MKRHWEIIADKLSNAGWTWGGVAMIDFSGRTIFVADAHRDDGNRYVVHADEKLAAFLELERITHQLRFQRFLVMTLLKCLAATLLIVGNQLRRQLTRF